jgi:hypothetical protein
MVVSAAATALACDERPDAILMCHNSNCAHATDPQKDDTIGALQDSLDLEYMDRPAIDGVELDILWDGDTGACLFAHDFGAGDIVTGVEAASLVAQHLAGPAERVSWRGNDFYVKIEIKAGVSGDGDAHTAEQVDQHLACALDMAELMGAAAIVGGRELQVLFEAEDVAFLRRLPDHPRWRGKSPAPSVEYRFAVNVKAPGLMPSDLESLGPGTTDRGIDVLAFHSTRFPNGQQQAYDSLGADMLLWMLDTALETLYTAEVYRPKYINTSEAILIRRWLED